MNKSSQVIHHLSLKSRSRSSVDIRIKFDTTKQNSVQGNGFFRPILLTWLALLSCFLNPANDIFNP